MEDRLMARKSLLLPCYYLVHPSDDHHPSVDHQLAVDPRVHVEDVAAHHPVVVVLLALAVDQVQDAVVLHVVVAVVVVVRVAVAAEDAVSLLHAREVAVLPDVGGIHLHQAVVTAINSYFL